MGKVGVFLMNGFSDWELSYLTPEIQKSDQYELIYFSETGQEVVSMGGLRVTPSLSLDEFRKEEVDLLILPGATAWERREITSINPLVSGLYQQGKGIAAICGATFYLGQLGLLDTVNHTSNDLGYLKAVVPEYQGSEKYQYAFAVRDNNIITANGIAPIEFAVEIFKALKLKPEEDIEKWYQLFKNGIWSE